MTYRVSVPGHKNYHAKQGHYVDEPTPAKARAAFRATYGKRYKLAEDTALAVHTPDGKLAVSRAAPTEVTTYDDSQFVRTALVLYTSDEKDEHGGGSVDVVDSKGRRLCQINLSLFFAAKGEDGLIVDVIDVDERWTKRRALVFPKESSGREVLEAGQIVSADFRRKVGS